MYVTSCRIFAGSTLITLMAARGFWIEADLLMWWAVNVAQLCSTHVPRLFVWPLLYRNSCVDARFVFPQDLQEKFDALSEQCRKYRKQIRVLAKRLKDAGGKTKAVRRVTSCSTCSGLRKVEPRRAQYGLNF